MKFVVAFVCAMALFVEPSDAKACTADQLAEIDDISNGFGPCMKKAGTSTKEACRCYDSFAENQDAVDCDEKYDPEKDTGKASLRAQCAKGLTLLGELRGKTVGVSFLVFSCVGLDRAWFL